MSDVHPSSRAPRGAAKWMMLGLNVVVIVACFIGAGVLLFGKSLRDRTPTVALERPTSSQAPATSGSAGTDASTVDSAPPETFPPADPQARNFLITGSDANACVDPDSPWGGAADPNRPGGDRPDTIMIMRIDPSTSQAAVLSFPRDLWVTIPGRGGKGKINGAFKPNEPQLLNDTIYANFGVPVDDYVQVDFCAFKRIVDAVGGVSVPFDTPIKDDNVQLLIPTAGCHKFSGDEALAYVRSRKMRYLDEDGDWKQEGLSDQARISRQQDFLRRSIQAALDKGILNPSVARGLIDTVLNDVVVSDGLSINRMLEFVGVLRNLDPGSIATYQIEADGAKISGNSVLVPRTEGENMQAVLAVFRGQASLATSPEQVFETTTTAAPRTTTTVRASGSTTTVRSGASTTSSTTLPVVSPEEIIKGQIIPSRDVVCN
jgi:LCP family protein required for cell wall assembly